MRHTTPQSGAIETVTKGEQEGITGWQIKSGMRLFTVM